MQKIMFDDNFHLTRAVQEGWKNMTRRFAEKVLVEDDNGELRWNGEFKKPRYKVGEVVAVAQSYREIEKEIMREGLPLTIKDSLLKSPGYRNKMYVRADLMPHQIRITSVRVERIQDISDEDCLREGIQAVRVPEGWVYVAGGATIHEVDRNRIWSGEIKLSEKCAFDTPTEAFTALIKKMAGKKAWDDNPNVYVYEFELV